MITKGTTVSWTSHAGHETTTKVGVAYPIPANSPVGPVIDEISSEVGKVRAKFNLGWRNHDSFLVLVDRGPGKQKAVYWPRVSALKETGEVECS